MANIKYPYHTALKSDIDFLEGLNHIKFDDGCEAFCHDISFGVVPLQAFRADVVYAETAWKKGVDKFNARAGSQTSYDDYFDGINRLIKQLGDKPIIILSGALEAKKLLHCENVFESKINGARAFLYCYNIKLPKELEKKDSQEIIKLLSNIYDSVYDFSCGYGRTGRIFLENNKTYYMSDYNAKCIRYIANNHKSWKK